MGLIPAAHSGTASSSPPRTRTGCPPPTPRPATASPCKDLGVVVRVGWCVWGGSWCVGGARRLPLWRTCRLTHSRFPALALRSPPPPRRIAATIAAAIVTAPSMCDTSTSVGQLFASPQRASYPDANLTVSHVVHANITNVTNVTNVALLSNCSCSPAVPG